MSNSKKVIYRHTLATRLTRWIMLTVFFIMTVVTILIFYKSTTAMMEQARERSMGMMANTNGRTYGVLTNVEVAIANTVPEIEERLNSPDDLYSIVERILRLNPVIVGSAIAFEPNYYPDKGIFFSPYAYRQDATTIATKQLG